MRWFFLLLTSLPLVAAENPLQKCMSGGCLKGAEKYLEKEADLFLFASFSMPDQAFIYFSKELEHYGGTFVLRGIPENSFSKLFQKLNQLTSIGVYAPFSIDPDLFEEHSPKAVPTLILKGEKKVDRLVGNAPIRDALERFSLSGDNKALAKRKLKGGSNG